MAVGGVLTAPMTSCASQGLLSAGAKHEEIFLLQNNQNLMIHIQLYWLVERYTFNSSLLVPVHSKWVVFKSHL